MHRPDNRRIFRWSSVLQQPGRRLRIRFQLGFEHFDSPASVTTYNHQQRFQLRENHIPRTRIGLNSGRDFEVCFATKQITFNRERGQKCSELCQWCISITTEATCYVHRFRIFYFIGPQNFESFGGLCLFLHAVVQYHSVRSRHELWTI